MNTKMNCQSCKYYKDEYCENLELKPNCPDVGCDYFEIKEKTIKYYMVCNDEETGYGRFDTLQEAIDSLNIHDLMNNDDGSFNHIEIVTEIHEEVYRKQVRK